MTRSGRADSCFDAGIVSPLSVADVDAQLVDPANLLVGAVAEQDECVQGSGGVGVLSGCGNNGVDQRATFPTRQGRYRRVSPAQAPGEEGCSGEHRISRVGAEQSAVCSERCDRAAAQQSRQICSRSSADLGMRRDRPRRALTRPFEYLFGLIRVEFSPEPLPRSPSLKTA